MPIEDGSKKHPVDRPQKSSKIVYSQYPKTTAKNALSELKDEGKDSVTVLDEVRDSDEDLGCADELINEPAEGQPAPKKRHRCY